MPVILDRIVIFNFKSFLGEIVITPIYPFSAVIGANGSGKSNFMEAICFALGETERNLRVRHVKDLIHGAYTGQASAQRAYVTVEFVLEDQSKKHFTRTVNKTSCEYAIDDQLVGAKRYLSELKNLNINVKANNFLLFQGATENMAMKSPQEKTQLLEIISGSVELKIEHERLRAELLKGNDEILYVNEKKRHLLAEKKQILLQKKDADSYEELKTRYGKLKLQLNLSKLYHIQMDVEDLQGVLATKESKIYEHEVVKENTECTFKDEKRQLSVLSNELERIEHEMTRQEGIVIENEGNCATLKTQVTHWEKKVSSANSLLEKAITCNKVSLNTIRELEEELKSVVEMKEEFESNMNTQVSSPKSSMELNKSQVEEYYRLKQVAHINSLEYVRSCDALRNQQEAEQNKLDNENRKKAELENQLKRNVILEAETKKRSTKLKQYIQEVESKLVNLTKEKSCLEETVTKWNSEHVESLRSQLKEVSELLNDAKTDHYTLSRSTKRRETIEILQSLFSGVYGRLHDVCRVIHSRYHVAVTKVLQRNMNSIVVSTSKVAISCISYLKEQQIDVETFLALDSLKFEPLKERLRNIEASRNVKLLYDVIEFSPSEIGNAILFATKNTLLCETAEDARFVAYEMEPKCRYDAVALDGTFYRKSGIISGGQAQLLENAKIWSRDQLLELKSKEDKLKEELKQIPKISEMESQINNLNLESQGLAKRLNYAKHDLNKIASEKDAFERKSETLQNELTVINDNIALIEASMGKRNCEIESIMETMKTIEDAAFKDFCQKSGLQNIQHYIEGDLRLHQEREERRLKLNEHYGRIQNCLDFEMSRDTTSAIAKSKGTIKISKKKLREAREQEAVVKIELENQQRDLEQLRDQYKAIMSENSEQEKKLNQYRRKIGIFAKSIIDARKEYVQVATMIQKKKGDWHRIFTSCKMENIQIQLLSDGVVNDSVETNRSSWSTRELNNQEMFPRIDFRKLPESMKIRTNDETVSDIEKKLDTETAEIKCRMELINNPNFKADERLQSILEELTELNTAFKEAHQKVEEIRKDFEEFKEDRCNRFTNCLQKVTAELDIIYKALVGDSIAQAILLPDNIEEPYLGGLHYSCIPPGKRLQPLEDLSGGERSIAALALLFAIHSFRPSPFFVLDEVDAALDNINTRNLARFLRSKADQTQYIVISLKSELFGHSDALIGICLDPDQECPHSRIFTFSLEPYSILPS